MIGVALIHEARRLGAINSFVESAIEEHILDVELSKRPRVGCSDAENHMDGGWLHHRTERLIVVDAGLLGVAANNPARLVPSNITVGVEFVFEHPLAEDDVPATRTRNKHPSVVVEQRLVFILHGGVPMGIQ